MYGFQGNNSQTYNYQNPNGSSFGNISQYTGPYHPYYSNATAAYNTFPSSDPPCSSLGVLPQEYSQVGNGMPRPYFYDTNSSYPRSYQGLPFNQSVEIPISNSFNTCPRNCHCCETLKPKYFTPSNAIHQQANTQSACDPGLNATYNGLRKGFDPGLWRDGNSQLPNIHESNDSATSWSLPKYGNSCKNETYPWPISQRQTGKFESGEHLASNVSSPYMMSQQHQRMSLPNSQGYTSIHSNSLRPIQTTRPSPGGNDDFLGNCRVGYQYNSIADLPKSNAGPHLYSNPSVNSIQTSSRPTCNLPGKCGGGFPYRFSSPNSKGIHENQKCVVETPMAQLPSGLVDSLQRHLPSNSLLDGTKEMPYCQPSMISSVHSIDSHSRRVFNTSAEGDARFLLNCNSSGSNNVIPSSRLQLPPIQSFKPSGMVVRNSSREYNQDLLYVPPKNIHINQHRDEFGISDKRSDSLSTDVSVRNFPLNNSDRYCANTSRENLNKLPPGDENDCILTSYVYNNQCEGKQVKVKLAYSEVVETDSKHEQSIDVPIKHLCSSGASVVGDLRHFLSTWDDGDEEDTHSVAQIVTPNDKNGLEHCLEENITSNEFASQSDHHQEKSSSSSKITCKNISLPNFELKKVSEKNTDYKTVPSRQDFSCASESSNYETQSYVDAEILNDTESIVHELSITQVTSKKLEKNKEVIAEAIVYKKDSNFESSSCENITSNISSIHNSEESREIEDCNLTCPSLDKNTQDSGTGLGNLYSQVKNVVEKSSDVQGSTEEVEKIFNSSDITSLQVISLDATACSSSVSESKDEMFQLESHVGGVVEDIPTEHKTVSHQGCSSEEEMVKCANLACKNMALRKSGVGNVVLSSEGSLNKSNSLLNSGAIPMDSDTMVFYNLTARVNVMLERLEVPPNSVCDRNVDSQSSLMESNQTDAVQELEHPKNCDDKDVSITNDLETSLKENIISSFINDNKEVVVYPNVMGNTDLSQEESKQRSINHFDGNCENDPQKTVAKYETQEIGALELSKISGSFVQDENEKHILDICSSVDSKENVAFSKSKELSYKSGEIVVDKGSKSKKFSQNSKVSALKSKDMNYKKSFKNANINFVTKFLKRSPCRAVQSIRKKYHTIELRNKIKLGFEMCSEADNKQNFLKRSRQMISKKANLSGKPKNDDVGKNYVREDEYCIRKNCLLDDVNQFYLVCGEQEEYEDGNDEFLRNNTMIKEGNNILTLNSSFSMKKLKSFEENNSFEYLHSSTADELSLEKSIEAEFLGREEKETQSRDVDGSCVIGNVEVFMGTVEEGSSLEEEAKNASFDIEVPVEGGLLGEDAIGVQYWNNFELGNALGVAMEVEVGSEIDCHDDLALLQPVGRENNHITDAETNDGSIISQDETANLKELQVPTSQNEDIKEIRANQVNMENLESKQLLSSIALKEKTEAMPVDLVRIDDYCSKDLDEDLNRSVTFPKDDKHLEKMHQIQSCSTYGALLQNTSFGVIISGKDPKQDRGLAAFSNNCSSDIKKENDDGYHSVTLQNTDSLTSRIKCTYQDKDEETISLETSHAKICTKSKSTISKPNRCLKIYKRQKIMAKNKPGAGLGDSELSICQLTCKIASADIPGYPIHLFPSKKRKTDFKGNMNLNFQKHVYNVDNDEEVFDFERSSTNDKKSSDVLDCKNVGNNSVENEKKKALKDVTFVTELKDNCKIMSKEMNKSGCEKSFTPAEKNNDFKDGSCLSSKGHFNVIKDISKEKTENLHLCQIQPQCDKHHCKEFERVKMAVTKFESGKKRQSEIENGSHSLSEESLMKVKKRGRRKEVLKLKTKTSLKSFDCLKLSSLKPSRIGFWRNKTWPFNKKYNKHSKHLISIKKSSECNSVATTHTFIPHTNILPCIVESYPTPPPPLLSPLPVLSESMAVSVSHCHSSSSPNIIEPDFYKSSSADDSCTLETNCSYPYSVSSLTIKQYSKDPSGLFRTQDNSDTSPYNMLGDSVTASSPFPSVCSQSNTVFSSELSSKSLVSMEPVSNNLKVSDCSKLGEPEIKIKNDTLALKNTSCVNSQDISPPNSRSLEMNDSSVVSYSGSNQDSSLNFACSSHSATPRVCITFKKVGIGDKKEKWVKSARQEGFADKQGDANKGEIKRNRTSSEHESPLPKVTIKKKTGEKGYQSFLSGFSSSSPSPSSSPLTSVPLTPVLIKTERLSLETPDDIMEENIGGASIKSQSFQTVCPLKCDVNSNSIQESGISNENEVIDIDRKADILTNDDLSNGVVEKKAGSGLVFVIRGLGSKVKEYSSKDVVAEQKNLPLDQIISSEKDRNVLETSECSVSSGDEGWESGPWSVWQPIVKLSRSCELDALARELHTVDGDDSKDSSTKPFQHCESWENNLASTPSHVTKGKIKNNEPNGMKLSDDKNQNGNCKMRFKRKDPDDKIETDIQQPVIIKEEKEKSSVTFSDSMKKVVSQKNLCTIDASENQEEVKRKKMQNYMSDNCSDFKLNKKLIKQENVSSKRQNEKKDLERANFSLSRTLSKMASEKMKSEARKENHWGNRHFQKGNGKEKRDETIENKIKKENTMEYKKQKSISKKNSSSKEIKLNNSLYKSVHRKTNGDAVEKERCHGNSKASSVVQSFHKRSLSKEKLTYMIHSSGKERSLGTSCKEGNRHSFQCEACCRKFSSQKWLSRHCKGMSHARVENAQRLAVQALLLLLTGDESKLLKPLTEKELSHLKTWSSHAAPSPLQLALKELLHPV